MNHWNAEARSHTDPDDMTRCQICNRTIPAGAVVWRLRTPERTETECTKCHAAAPDEEQT